MATKKVKINSVEYEAKQINVPLSSGSGSATFYETSDATAGAEHILEDYDAYGPNGKVAGQIPVLDPVTGVISQKSGKVTIPAGYYPSAGSAQIAAAEQDKLTPANIRKNVTILGVTGSMDPQEGVTEQQKTVTPTKSQQTITPDSGYTHLSQVTVEAIPAAYITTADANATADKIAKNATAYVNGKKITGTHTDPSFTLANGVLTIA